MPRKRKKPIEDRSFLGRVGAILSGEASQRAKKDARQLSAIVRPAPKAKAPKRKRAKKQPQEKYVKHFML